MLGFKRRGGRSAAEVCVGVALAGDQTAIVAVERSSHGSRPRVVAWASQSVGSPVELGPVLARFSEDHGMRGAIARVTLAPSDYDLKLVERPPNIPDEELADATRWLIRDLVEIDVETAAIAVLTIPDQRGRARAPHMFVAAAREDVVSAYARTLAEAGLACAGFEIVETAMLALEANAADPVASGAMVRIEAKSSVLTLASEQQLFLARPLRVEATELEAAAERASTARPDDPAVLAALEPMLLDVQRSLDYYESEYGRTPATRLLLLPGCVDVDSLAPALAESLRPLRVEAWPLERCFDFAEQPPSRDLGLLALACGAAVAGDVGLGRDLLPQTLRLKDSGGFGLSRVLQAAAVLTTLGLGWAAHQSWQLRVERASLAALAGREQQLQAEVEAAATQLDAATASGGSIDPAELRARRDERLALLRDLGEREPGGRARFSAVLVALARQDREDVWLERIEVSESGESLALAGRALDAQGVPKLLRRLRQEPVFAGRKFASFEIERDPKPDAFLRFRVASRGPQPEGPGADR